MELSVGNNKRIDLLDSATASVDYEIFSDKVESLVSTITGLDLPSTDKNIAALEIGERQEAILSSEFGNAFIGEINVDSQSFNSVNDMINTTFFERLKTIFENMDITIGDIGNNGDIFTWNFNLSGDVPLHPTSGKWFLTGGDFNGFSDNGNNMENIPLYPAKNISHKNQMFWTIDLYSFINKVFTYYGVGHTLTQNDIVFGRNMFSQLYIFIPVTKFVCVHGSELAKRNLGVGLDMASKSVNDGLFSFYNSQLLDDYGLEQALVENGGTQTRSSSIVGTTDTSYTVSIYDYGLAVGGKMTMLSKHLGVDGISNVSIPLGGTQGTVDAILQVYNNDSLIKTVTLAQIFGGVVGSLNTITDTDFALETVDFDLLSADDLTFKLGFRFNGYQFYDTTGTPSSDNLKTINGTPTYDELDDICVNVNPPDILVGYGLFPLDGVTVFLAAQDQLVPVRRIYDYSDGIAQDQIDIDASLAHTNVYVKDLLADISKRYNLRYWLNGDGKLNITNIHDRYDKTQVVRLYESNSEPYTIEYLIDTVGTFEYKNNVNGIYPLEIENTDNNIGDVIEYKVSDGENNISISLKSCIATDQIYGEPIVAEDVSLLDINSNYYFWGYSNNTQLLPTETPILHGFLSQSSVVMNSRIPHVSRFNTGTTEVPYYEVLTYYTKNGEEINLDKDYLDANYYYPSLTNAYGESIMLADSDGVIDTSLPLYKNFEYLFDEDQSTITIEGILSHEEKSSILDGVIVQINGMGGHDANYMVLSIEGFLFDQYKSVVKLKIKKYVTSF